LFPDKNITCPVQAPGRQLFLSGKGKIKHCRKTQYPDFTFVPENKTAQEITKIWGKTMLHIRCNLCDTAEQFPETLYDNRDSSIPGITYNKRAEAICPAFGNTHPQTGIKYRHNMIPP
jgi:hypothetical protein